VEALAVVDGVDDDENDDDEEEEDENEEEEADSSTAAEDDMPGTASRRPSQHQCACTT
jgi:hypothetical protein